MKYRIAFFGTLYKILRPIIFLFNSEVVHGFLTNLGEFFGKYKFIRKLIRKFLVSNSPLLKQKIYGINFERPVGLAAGFDYQAKLTQILPALGFGFETIGTITNTAYEGNPKPRMGRLVKSKSLMVNKGFKNEGIKKVIKKLNKNKFEIPIGISIGKTNTSKLDTQEKAVEDIIAAFKIAENSKIDFSYYELNISCPNLIGNVDFYESKKLNQLLKAVFSLKLKYPVFIKMPISKTNDEILKMMDVIIKYPVKGIIIGNLQKDRKDKSLLKEEVDKFKIGNFSGKATWERSNELIELLYKKYGKRLTIIGTGGIFNAKDAYKKIRSGASLVQLISGLIFQGPQLVAGINLELENLIKKDGFKNISEAIGADFK